MTSAVPHSICLASDSLPPIINGVNTVLKASVDVLERHGWNVHIAGPWQREVLSIGGSMCLLPSHGVPLYPDARLVVRGSRILRCFLDRERVQHIHAFTPLSVGFHARSAARSLRLPFSASFLTDYVQISSYIPGAMPLAKLLGWRYIRWFYAPATRVFCPERPLADHLICKGILNAETRLSGVDTKRFHPRLRSERIRRPLLASVGRKHAKLLCLFVGRISAEKNVPFLIELARMLPNIGMLVIGDGPQRATVAKTAPRNVFLVGAVSDSELAAWYASADVFVFPSRLEAGAGAPLEAMAAGLPVLTTRTQGLEDLIEPGRNGAFFSDEDVRACASLLERLCDDQRRLRWSLGARATAESRSWETVLTPWIAALEETQASGSWYRS